MSDNLNLPGLDVVPLAPIPELGERFAAIIESLPDAILCIDRQWYITYANPEAIRISRLQPELFASVTFWDLFPDVGGTEMETRYRRAMSSGHRDRFEFYYAPFDVWVDIHILPTDNGFALFYSDITQQKKAEARGAEFARRVLQAFEAIPQGVVIIDPEWRFTFANERALELVGRPDIVGHNIFKIFPGNNDEPFGSAYRATMQTRRPTEFEAFHGEPINTWFKVQAKPYEDGIIVFFSDITARKMAELREQQTARRLAQVLEATTDAVIALDRNWRYTYLNRHAQRLIDPEKKLLGKNIWEEFPVAVGSAAWDIYHLSMNEGLSGTAEVFYPAPINAWLSLQSEPTPDGIVVFFRDITEDRRQDEIMQHQQDLLAAVQEVARLATWELDYATGKIVYGPGSFESLLGHPLSEVASLDDRERFFLPGHAVLYRAAIREAIRTGAMMVHEFAVRAEDGSVLWIESRGQLVPGTEASPRLRGMSFDVTQRKLDQQDLVAEQIETERRRAELETIYRTTPIGLALLDPVDFTFLNLNDHEAEMLGFHKDELIGRPLREIAPPEDVPGLMEMMQSVAQGHVIKDRHLEGKLAARPSRHRYWRVNYSPIFNEDGCVRAISTASIEITNQKKAELALIQSEKLAAVGRLASSISHEINNPLEAITNLLYLIAMDKKLPDELHGFVSMAQSELSRISQIATQTLRFHRQAVAPTRVTAQELITAVARLYTGRLANSHISVESRYDSDTQILCFENDIRQVLNNLIANAIDAMRMGGRLMIRSRDAHSNGIPGVRITIADTGHGMNPAIQARIFEPFFTTKDLNGTGLGLWISAGIVERHLGHLRVRSSDDPVHHGAVFTLFLPCKEMELP